MRMVRLRHNAVHWTVATPAERLRPAARRLMLVGIVAGLLLCLVCCGAVGYFLIR